MSNLLPIEIPPKKDGLPSAPPALRLLARERMAECVRIFQENGYLLTMPTVSFDLQGRTAGFAFCKRNHVQLNAVLLSENEDAFVARTPGHEIAHIAAFGKARSKIKPHGPEWASAMALIGQDASRLHAYDATRSARFEKKYAYACSCTTHMLTIIRHKAAPKRQYSCRICKTDLVYQPKAVHVPKI